MYVWHGTSSKKMEDIIKNGLRPAKEVESNYAGKLFPFHADKIYVSSHFPKYYADLAVEKVGGFPILIELEIGNRTKIYNDEDYDRFVIDQSTWLKFGSGAVQKKSIKKISAIYDGTYFEGYEGCNNLSRIHIVKTIPTHEFAETIYSECRLLWDSER